MKNRILEEIYDKYMNSDINQSRDGFEEINNERFIIIKKINDTVGDEVFRKIEQDIGDYAYFAEKECFIRGYKEAVNNLREIAENILLFVSISDENKFKNYKMK
ncbi:hypothetical protein [uncultured Anaerofustis sp.]|uniref:hypothetical protein n=1 Tax=uncultured Anaerofustis sp. TaxID=904996 RepID=UPI0025D753FE|nr:hypothetical protein [uncultured Anaerofustis sp.]